MISDEVLGFGLLLLIIVIVGVALKYSKRPTGDGVDRSYVLRHNADMPLTNVDGTPMTPGGVDVRGKPFGHHRHWDRR